MSFQVSTSDWPERSTSPRERLMRKRQQFLLTEARIGDTVERIDRCPQNTFPVVVGRLLGVNCCPGVKIARCLRAKQQQQRVGRHFDRFIIVVVVSSSSSRHLSSPTIGTWPFTLFKGVTHGQEPGWLRSPRFFYRVHFSRYVSPQATFPSRSVQQLQRLSKDLLLNHK